MSYLSDLRHFLNEERAIAEVMHREAREMGNFLALIVDAVTMAYPEARWGIDTGITCRTAGCQGEIIGALDDVEGPVHWYCLDGGADGVISGWRSSRWDNTDGQSG